MSCYTTNKKACNFFKTKRFDKYKSFSRTKEILLLLLLLVTSD